MAKVIGIDLGTTNSVVAVMEGKEPKVIANEEGARTTPSVVAFPSDGQRLVGQIAKRQAVQNPKGTVFSIKRFMGRRYDEVSQEIQRVPYQVKRGSNDLAAVEIQGRDYTPPEISAMILQKLKVAAEAYLGEPVKQAVITVPAYFNDAQRQATKDAGTIAGLEVLRLVNEPTAASLAYSLDKKTEEKIAVFDLGGGTFDISILEVDQGAIEVAATNGDGHLGGDDFDDRIIRYVVEEFRKDQGIDLTKDPMALQRLREASEKAKVELSGVTETEINLPYITADQSGPKHLNLRLSRAKFEQLVDDLIERTRGPVAQACKDAGIRPNEIDEVVLVGGSTRIPKVQEFVKTFFGKEPNRSVNPDEVVAVGAAIQAAVLSGEVTDMVLIDVTPLSLGIETMGKVMTKLIERNTNIPTRRSQVFSTAADSQPQVDVHVLQGEREFADDNRSLGRFVLDGIAPAPRGVPQIEVTFDIDANGIVSVSAKDKNTGKEQSIRIEGSSGLSKSEIDRMVQQAQSHASEDEQRRKRVDARNNLDGLIYQAEKMVREHREKIPVASLGKLESAVSEAKPLLEKQDADPQQLQSAAERIQAAQHEAGQALYQQESKAGQASPPPGEEPQAPPRDDVVDADFTEEK
jgi:molecular chaperone DnaK